MEIVEQSKSTTLSLRAFSAEAGVPLPGLYHWRSKLKSSVTAQLRGFSEMKPPFAPTPPTTPRREGMIEVRLANGRVVRVTGGQVDAQVLQTVIEAAEAGGAC